jgi:hypothetical protein
MLKVSCAAALLTVQLYRFNTTLELSDVGFIPIILNAFQTTRAIKVSI